jgi:hypothetical protein
MGITSKVFQISNSYQAPRHTLLIIEIFDLTMSTVSPTWKFQKSGVQYRSPRISETEWNKHKEDIIAQFLLTDIASMKEWMLLNRDFEAT